MTLTVSAPAPHQPACALTSTAWTGNEGDQRDEQRQWVLPDLREEGPLARGPVSSIEGAYMPVEWKLARLSPMRLKGGALPRHGAASYS